LRWENLPLVALFDVLILGCVRNGTILDLRIPTQRGIWIVVTVGIGGIGCALGRSRSSAGWCVIWDASAVKLRAVITDHSTWEGTVHLAFILSKGNTHGQPSTRVALHAPRVGNRTDGWWLIIGRSLSDSSWKGQARGETNDQGDAKENGDDLLGTY